MVNKKHQQILFKELVLSTKENQALAVVPIGANSGANIVAVTPLVGKVLHYRSYSKNRIVMSKNIHFLIVKRDYLLNPVLRLLHRFWKFCLNKSISESIILIKSPLKWDKIFSLLESCYHDDFSILALLFAKPNKETESTELMHRLQKKNRT